MPEGGGGGSFKDKVSDMLSDMNWVEVGLGILGTAALYYTIYYYRYNVQNARLMKKEIENRIDDIDIKVADIQSAMQRDVAQPAVDGFGFF
jgi:hypothetical protein